MDRKALVSRHNPANTRLDTRSPLTVGNGEFAFTADITGLQSFPDRYLEGIPLCTQAQWGWHTTPIGEGLNRDDFRLRMYDVNGRRVVTLLNDVLEAGRHDVPWQGRDRSGRVVGSGLYFYRVEAPGFTQSGKMTLTK